MFDRFVGFVQHGVQHGILLLREDTGMSVWVSFAGMLAAIAGLAMGAYYLLRFFLLRFVAGAVSKNRHLMLKAMYDSRVFHWMAFWVPSVVVYACLPALNIIRLPYSIAPHVVQNGRLLSAAFMIIVGSLVLSAFLSGVEARYRYFSIARQYSIKSYIQVIKIILFALAAILIFSMLLGKSPAYFLTGLGAMTAVLMLVFRDSILGFVASIHLSVSDMVRIDDWVEMPNYGANGSVTDISLNTIKVRNFDNTIVSIPTYAFLSNGVKNWRGMSESGGRRIKRSLLIDIHSIRFCSPAMLERLSSISLLRKLLQTTLSSSLRENSNEIAKLLGIDGRCLTNLTLFRMYLGEWLKNHPRTHPKMTFMVRELEAAGKGLPVEIYMFAGTTDWIEYEAFQAEIFDYIYAVLPLFGLKGFQHFSGEMQSSRVYEEMEKTAPETTTA